MQRIMVGQGAEKKMIVESSSLNMTFQGWGDMAEEGAERL